MLKGGVGYGKEKLEQGKRKGIRSSGERAGCRIK